MRVAPVDRESVATVPGAPSEGEVEFTHPDGAIACGPGLMSNAASMRKTRKWQFGACSEDPEATDKLVTGAMCYAEQYSAGMGVARRSSRSTHPRPRVSLFAMDYPFSHSDPVWLLLRAFLSKVAAPLAPEPYRLLKGAVDHPDLSGALWEGAGFV